MGSTRWQQNQVCNADRQVAYNHRSPFLVRMTADRYHIQCDVKTVLAGSGGFFWKPNVSRKISSVLEVDAIIGTGMRFSGGVRI